MRKQREYLALLDDGHEYKVFYYISEHRAGSRNNKEDCQAEYKSRYGYRSYKRIDWDSFRCHLCDGDC